MKKSLMALLLALAVALSGAVWVTAEAVHSIDDVVYTQRTVSGDPAAADGLTLQHKVTYKEYLHWDNTLTFADGEHVSETKFTYTSDREYESRPYEYSGVMIWKNANADFDPSVPIEKLTGFSKITRELYDETAVGEIGYRTVRLSDAYEYYPFDVQVDLANNYFSGYDYLYWQDDRVDDAYYTGWMHIYEGFNDFFRIPILTDEEYGISIDKRRDGGYGSSFGMTEASVNQDQYYMETYSVAAETGAWFIFNTHTNQGNVVDTSLIPGGYGIYYLPAEHTEFYHFDGILVDEMRCMYSMDPVVEVQSLHMNADDTKLIVSYLDEEKTLWVDVVDAETGTKLQRLELYSYEDDYDPWIDFIPEQNCIVYLIGDEQVILLVEEGDEFTIEINVPMNKPENVYYSPYETRIGWDGKRLAMVGTYGDSYRDVDVAVAIYTADGLQYAGVYTCTLTGKNYRYNNRPVDGYPKVIAFK